MIKKIKTLRFKISDEREKQVWDKFYNLTNNLWKTKGEKNDVFSWTYVDTIDLLIEFYKSHQKT